MVVVVVVILNPMAETKMAAAKMAETWQDDVDGVDNILDGNAVG